jgi:hypothetical protein
VCPIPWNGGCQQPRHLKLKPVTGCSGAFVWFFIPARTAYIFCACVCAIHHCSLKLTTLSLYQTTLPEGSEPDTRTVAAITCSESDLKLLCGVLSPLHTESAEMVRNSIRCKDDITRARPASYTAMTIMQEHYNVVSRIYSVVPWSGDCCESNLLATQIPAWLHTHTFCTPSGHQ